MLCFPQQRAVVVAVVVLTALFCATNNNASLLFALALSGISVPTVVYFDARGRAEVTRCIFQLAEQEFVDQRYAMELKLDENGNPAGFHVPEFEQEQATGKFNVNMDRLPVLEINGATIGQSPATERAAAQYCGMMGKDETERAVIDCIVENVRDVKDSWRAITIKYGFKPSAEKNKAQEEWFTKPSAEKGGFRHLITKLNASLPTSSSSAVHAFGNSITLADVVIWNLLKDTFTEPDDVAMLEAALSADETSVERLVAIAENIHNAAAMKEWLKTRPTTNF